MDINIGDKFLVPTRGNDPFHWNFKDYDESVVEATVIEPSIGVSFFETEGVFWNNPSHGYIVLMQTGDGYFQWVPVDALRPLGSYKPKYKVGDVVRVLGNQYTSCPVSEVGRLAYVTDVMEHGCQLSLVPDSHPDEHSERSLFFMNHEFEPYEG